MTLQQDISFCTSADGVMIASTSTGTGTPIVRARTWLSHLECDARHEESQAYIRAVSRGFSKALHVSPRTVEMHVSGAMKALRGAATRAEAVHRAHAFGLFKA